MHIYVKKAAWFYALLFVTALAFGQKNIVISDSLGKNSDPLKVKMGSQGLGKIWNFKFGDYAVISSKQGWQVSSTKGNLLNTKTDSKKTDKFSFSLSDKAGNIAKVNAANNIEVQSLQSFQLSPGFFIGTDKLIQESNNFSAFITVDSDTTVTWMLLMNMLKVEGKDQVAEAWLTNGDRKIAVVSASSNKLGEDKRAMPAMGYELIEGTSSLAAVQYYGGGNMGMNKNIVWLYKDLDDQVKLILAAAMTALLQIKVISPMGL